MNLQPWDFVEGLVFDISHEAEVWDEYKWLLRVTERGWDVTNRILRLLSYKNPTWLLEVPLLLEGKLNPILAHASKKPQEEIVRLLWVYDQQGADEKILLEARLQQIEEWKSARKKIIEAEKLKLGERIIEAANNPWNQI